MRIKSLRKEGDSDESHIVVRARVFLGVMLLVMLGTGFIYQGSTHDAKTDDMCISQESEADQQKSDEVITEDQLMEESEETDDIAEAIVACHSSLDENDVDSFADILKEESTKYGYDWELILAIIRTESHFDVRAKSHKGAIGLMQLMPSTAKWLSPQLGLKYKGRNSLYDPELNIKLGTYYLHMMHQKFGNIEEAIVAYNRGPARLTRYLNRGQELRSNYLAKVMGY